MGTCLVTRLKGVVSDSTLPIFGATKISLNALNSQIRLGSEAPGGLEVKLLNTTFADGSTTKIINDYYQISNVSKAEGEVLVAVYEPNKIHWMENLLSIDEGIAQIKKLSTLQILGISPLSNVDLTEIEADSMPMVEEFKVYSGSQLQGDAVAFFNAFNPTKLRTLTFLAEYVKPYSIKALGRLTALTSANLSASPVSGTIEEFVAEQRKNGRNTASSLELSGMGAVTFDGSTFGNGTLSWTDTTITLGGKTINA